MSDALSVEVAGGLPSPLRMTLLEHLLMLRDLGGGQTLITDGVAEEGIPATWCAIVALGEGVEDLVAMARSLSDGDQPDRDKGGVDEDLGGDSGGPLDLEVHP